MHIHTFGIFKCFITQSHITLFQIINLFNIDICAHLVRDKTSSLNCYEEWVSMIFFLFLSYQNKLTSYIQSINCLRMKVWTLNRETGQFVEMITVLDFYIMDSATKLIRCPMFCCMISSWCSLFVNQSGTQSLKHHANWF